MYVSTLSEAIQTVAGMEMMLDELYFRDAFREWLIEKKLKRSLPFWWGTLVEMYLQEKEVEVDQKIDVEEDQKIEKFFLLLNEFFSDQNIDTEEPKKPKQKMHLKIAQGGEPDVAYLSLPDHPGRGSAGSVARQVRARDHIENYNGPDLYLDFDKDDVLIGVEILV